MFFRNDHSKGVKTVLQFFYWLIILVTGYLVWNGTNGKLEQSLMGRDYFKPVWRAGKLSEAFADQIISDGMCQFYAFSTLQFTPPSTFNHCNRIDIDLDLPKTSYFLIPFQRHDNSQLSDGIRISRNDYYPSGHLLFNNDRAESTKWLDHEITFPKKLNVQLIREAEQIRYLINGISAGVFRYPSFHDCKHFRITAGPTGMTVNSIAVNGETTADRHIMLKDDFNKNLKWNKVIAQWMQSMLHGLAFTGFIFLLFLTVQKHQRLMQLKLILLATIGWLFWGLLFLSTNTVIIFLIIILQTSIFIIGVRSISSFALKDEFVRQKPSQTPITLFLMLSCSIVTLVLILIVSCISVSLPAEDYHEVKSRKYGILKIFPGEKLVMSGRSRDFAWNSVIRLKKDGIVEFVMRKAKGERSKELHWYSVTLSADKTFQSGIYYTHHYHQQLLTPFDLSIEPFKDIPVRISFTRETIEVCLNNMQPIRLNVSDVTTGEMALVPIVKSCRIIKTQFQSKPAISSVKSRFHPFRIGFLLLLLGYILLIVSFRYRFSKLGQWRQTFALLMVLHPILIVTILFLLGLIETHNFVVLALCCSIIIHYVLIFIKDTSRSILRFFDYVILLIVLEIMMHFLPQARHLPSNPVQSGIPEHLYWYQAASSRRWNPYIEFNVFRDKKFSTRRTIEDKQNNIRILCLGSSSTAGGYPEYLQNDLNKTLNTNVEVMDCGIPGTTTTNLANFYTNFLVRFQPDIVTINLMRNDMKFLAILSAEKVFELETATEGLNYYKGRLYNSLDRLMLYRTYRFVIQHILGGSFIEKILFSVPQSNPHILEQALRYYSRNIEKMIHTAKQFQQNPVLLIEPFFMSDGYDHLSENRRLKAVETLYSLASSEKIPIIDLNEIVDSHRNDILFIDDVHHTVHGKKIIAQAISQKLTRIIETISEKDQKKNNQFNVRKSN